MSSSYFEHDADSGIIGRGLTIEQSFEAVAHAVFAIITNIEAIHPRTVVVLEFEESDLVWKCKSWNASTTTLRRRLSVCAKVSW